MRLQTGYRQSEIRSVKRSQLHLEGDRPYVACDATATNNGTPVRQYIQPALAHERREFASGLSPKAVVFLLPDEANCARMLWKDLVHARDAWIHTADDSESMTDRGATDFLLSPRHNGERLDLHAGRHLCSGPKPALRIGDSSLSGHGNRRFATAVVKTVVPRAQLGRSRQVAVQRSTTSPISAKLRFCRVFKGNW